MSPVPAETDVIVIGSGAAGLSAALTAAGGGARVVVLERQANFGGTSNFFEGTFAVESDMQRARYITYSRDEAFKNIMEFTHWRANPRLVRAIVNESAATIAWLQKQGVEFTEVNTNLPDSPVTYHVVKGKGEAVVKALVTRARQMGIEMAARTAVKRLIKTGERVSGVIYETGEEEARLSAKAVVIASGGYANNKEWIKKYTGFDLDTNLIPIGNVDKMGDGIRMAFEAGAAEEGIGTLELFRVGPIGPEFAMASQLEFALIQPDLWVDASGTRFCDESIGFYDTPVGNAAARQKEGYTYSLFDETIKQRMTEKGIFKSTTARNPPGSRLTGLDAEIEAALARNSTEVFRADSIEELAIKAGMNPEGLKATIEEYNKFCEQGYDALFAKDRRYLWPLKSPKYYAIKARTVFLGTMGGIKINDRTEVIDKKGKVIPGLYTAGLDAGGMYGDSYAMRPASGLASAFATNSGRIAGKNASAFCREK